VADPRNLNAPVAEVTLTEDRAHVRRRGRIDLSAGRHTLCLGDVAPVLVDKTLLVTVEQGDAHVSDARVRRERIVTSEGRPEAVRELDERLRELGREQHRLAAERDALGREESGVQAVGVLCLAEIAEDALWGRVEPESWSRELAELRQKRELLRDRGTELSQRLARVREEVERIEARRSAGVSPATATATSIHIDVTLARDAEISLRIDYLVPGAAWRPYHTAHLVDPDTAPRVRWECQGCVWQRTGETWEDVVLFLSTERPSLGAAPPLLESDVVVASRKGSAVVVETREKEIHTAGLGAGAIGADRAVPGIDDGGEALHLQARAKATIPSDGRPYRVPIFELESPAEAQLVLAAELAPAVLLRTRQENTSSRPILAGPVDLIRSAGLAGRTSTLFVAPGERFELGWGPDAALRVHRQARTLELESKMLSSWSSVPHRVKVHISNLGPDSKAIEVTERVPVSEVEKVKLVVDKRKTTDGAQPDDDGFVRWDVTVGPFGRETVRLGYTIEKHQDVVGL